MDVRLGLHIPLMSMRFTSIFTKSPTRSTKSSYRQPDTANRHGGFTPNTTDRTNQSWDDAKAYCRRTNKRLPTEVEWEKAGCGGLEGLRYPWRGAINEHLANYNYVIGKPTPVGNYEPNGYGLYDVIGNVAEWCADVYDTIGFLFGKMANCARRELV